MDTETKNNLVHNVCGGVILSLNHGDKINRDMAFYLFENTPLQLKLALGISEDILPQKPCLCQCGEHQKTLIYVAYCNKCGFPVGVSADNGKNQSKHFKELSKWANDDCTICPMTLDTYRQLVNNGNFDISLCVCPSE